MSIVLLLVVPGLKEGDLQPYMRLRIFWEFKNIKKISKNIINCMLRIVNIYVCRYVCRRVCRQFSTNLVFLTFFFNFSNSQPTKSLFKARSYLCFSLSQQRWNIPTSHLARLQLDSKIYWASYLTIFGYFSVISNWFYVGKKQY